MPGVAVNVAAANKHVGEVEQKIRVVKERCRGITATLPFKCLLDLMMIELLHFWLCS